MKIQIFKSVIDKIDKHSPINLFGKCLLFFVFMYAYHFSTVYVFPFVVILFSLLFIQKNYLHDFRFWIFVFIVFLPHLIVDYYDAANHFFLLLYLLIVWMISCCYPTEQIKILKQNAKWLLILIMFFSVVQKLLSEQFMSGETISFLGYTGQLFKLPLWFFSETQNAVNHNITLISKYDYQLTEDILLKEPFAYFKEFVLFFTYFTLLVELLFIVLFFIKSHWVKNAFFSLFTGALLITRHETGFVCLLSILLMMQLGEKKTIFRSIYFFLYIIALSLTYVRWGFV